MHLEMHVSLLELTSLLSFGFVYISSISTSFLRLKACQSFRLQNHPLACDGKASSVVISFSVVARH